jgi:hypothetical protein
MGRTGTGATIATLPLTGAAIAAASDKPGLMWVLIGVSVVVILATVANRLRWLHRLPLIGAPRPKVTFKVNGSSSLVVRLAPPDPGRLEEARTILIEAGVDNPEPSVRPEPRTAQIEVGVVNPSSFERIDRALINFFLPVGLQRRATDASGNTTKRDGVWAPPTIGRICGQERGYDYWSEDHVDYAAGGGTVMYFEATFDDEGVYPICMRISAPALYEKNYDTDAEIHVEVADDGPVERLTDLIAEGARIRDDMDQMNDSALRVALMDFSFGARQLADAQYPAGIELLSAKTAFEGRRTDRDYDAALLRDDLAALYTIRMRLGAAEDAT